jgi:hypothetical protein
MAENSIGHIVLNLLVDKKIIILALNFGGGGRILFSKTVNNDKIDTP